MIFPPGFLDDLRTRVSISQVVGRKVVWDLRKSHQGKGDMWAPCPFHQEKSASFHVDDRKGFYYCFGCHAKGDSIGFVMETENVSFPEAVQILAAEAGMPVPEADPRAKAVADRRSQLAEVMEAAVRWLRNQLRTGAAAEARAYLDRRGLSKPTQERFEIGFAPDQRQGLFQALTGQGIAADLIVEAGLCATPDPGDSRGSAPYDRFRGRITFPIRDGRGRCIGLGGRAMDPNARAKYLNSPETPLFDKGRSLYNHAPAREAAGKGQPLIVAEGYMDVIALAQAGFGAAVAPLGTAITEDQLKLLWRIADEPIVALDGDRAGLAAAYRLVDLALPLVEAGKTLRFALLPTGKDPDDLIRDSGAPAMQAVLDAAVPLVTLLWRRETEDRVLDSPERRAALDKALRSAVSRIADPSTRDHYGAELKRLRADLFGFAARSAPQGTGPRIYTPRARGFGEMPRRWKGAPAPVAIPMPATLGSDLARPDDGGALIRREAVVLATFLHIPALLASYGHKLEDQRFRGPGHAAIAMALLTCPPEDPPQRVQDAVAALVGSERIERLLSERHVRLAPSVRSPDDADRAALCLAEELAKLAAADGDDIAEAERELTALPVDENSADDPLTDRLRAAAEARFRAVRAAEGDAADFEIATNGMRLDRSERSSFDDLLASIAFDKRRPAG